MVITVATPSPLQRLPAGCLPGFPARYTVVPGDTMWLIAQRFGVPVDQLIAANEHIRNPNIVFPGDVLCVPTILISPCCLILDPQRPGPPGLTPDTW
jgi:spore coat assembly protein SafA